MENLLKTFARYPQYKRCMNYDILKGRFIDNLIYTIFIKKEQLLNEGD